MSIRASAVSLESSVLDLARRGRGFLGHRQRGAERLIDEFVGLVMTVPAGSLPPQIQREAVAHIEQTIEALELHASKLPASSPRQLRRRLGVVRLVYALREAQQRLMEHRPVLQFAHPSGTRR